MRTKVLLLCALALVACPKKNGDDDSGDDDSAEDTDDDAIPVRAEAADRGVVVQLVGSGAAVDAERRADVMVEVNGTVEALRVEEGDRVVAGQVLAQLKNPALRTEWERASANLARAEDDWKSSQNLFDRGFLARSDYEQARLAADTARLAAEQAKAAWDSAELKSPIAGTVALRGLRFGEAVGPGRVAFTVVDLSLLRVEPQLPERELARVKVGQEARIRSTVVPDRVVAGRVERIAPVVDAATGTVKVTVALDPQQTELRPGMYVTVDIVVDTHADAVRVPKRALVWTEGKPYVFVAADGKVARKAVELGFAEQDRVEITRGVDVGDQVVTVGQTTLREGATVRIAGATAPEATPTPEPASPTPPPAP